MLHGGGQTAHTWQRVANRLAYRYYLIAGNLRELPDGRLAWKWDPSLFNRQGGRQEERRVNQARLWEEVRRISCPTLVVHGRESDILTRENGEALAQAVPHGRYVCIEGAG